MNRTATKKTNKKTYNKQTKTQHNIVPLLRHRCSDFSRNLSHPLGNDKLVLQINSRRNDVESVRTYDVTRS